MALMFFQYLNTPPSTGINVSYSETVPDNATGNNGDVVIITTTRKHYKKIDGAWVEQLAAPASGTGSYTNKTELLAAANSQANQLAVVVSEPGNQYLRNSDNTKWVVLSGNKYPTTDLPSDVDFIIPTGTVIFDTTTNKQLYE